MLDSTDSASAVCPAMIAGFLVTFGVRSLAIKFGWSLPVFRESTKRERWKSDRKDSPERLATMTGEPGPYRGNDTLLLGIILSVLAFWLFAQTTLNIAPAMAADLGIPTNVMNIAVAITALFSGIFIVVVGGLADRIGRVKILMWGVSRAPSFGVPGPFIDRLRALARSNVSPSAAVGCVNRASRSDVYGRLPSIAA